MIDCCFSLSCRSKGAWDYYRSMLVCRLLMQHWIKEDLPVAQLLQANHTVFSEESGEIALSVLVHSQPPNTHTELTTTRTRHCGPVRPSSTQIASCHRYKPFIFSLVLSLYQTL